MLRNIATTFALVGGAAATQEVPIFCRLLAVALQEAEGTPIVGDVNVSTQVDVPVIGNIDVSVSHMAIDNVDVVDCDASVTDQGTFTVEIKKLALSLKELDWKYSQGRWPHVSDYGRATADTSFSFTIGIDMKTEQHNMLDMKLNQLDMHLGAQEHTWITKIIEKTTNFMTPAVSKVVELVARKTLNDVMGEIYKEGACAFVQGALKDLSLVDLSFTTYQPVVVEIPIIGNVSIRVNSTEIKPPTTMTCEKLGFNGTALHAHVKDLPFETKFLWAYQKANSSFWHNNGNGSASIVAGTMLDVDIMKPSQTKIAVLLPTLNIKLDAASDDWMYKAVGEVMPPLVKFSLQEFGGKLLAHYIEKCIEDPTCPHVKPMPQAESSASAVQVFV